MTYKIKLSKNQDDGVEPLSVVSSNEMLVSVRNIISVFYRKKYWLILSVVISMCITLYYSLAMKEVWMAKAIVNKPTHENISEIKKNVSSILSIVKNEDNGIIIITSGQKMSNSPVDGILDLESILQRFLTSFDSYDNKIEFIRSNPRFKDRLVVTDDNTDSYQDVLLNSLSKNIEISQEGKVSDNKFKLTYKSNSKYDSLNLLSEYITFINNKVFLGVSSDIKSLVNAKLSELEGESNFLRKKNRMASEGEIKNQYNNGAIDVNKIPSNDSEWQDVNVKISILKDYLLIEGHVYFESVSYLMMPRAGLNPETPSVRFLLFLSLVFGVVLGSMLVLVSSFFDKNSNKVIS